MNFAIFDILQKLRTYRLIPHLWMLNCIYQTGWRSGNAVDSYSGGSRFESLPRHQLS
jgi:hypothetical protein